MKKEIIKKNCKKCNNEFDCTEWNLNGKIISPTLCSSCKKIEDDKRSLEYSEKEVSETNIRLKIEWLNSCGVKGIFKNKTFDNFKFKLQPKAFDALKNYKWQSIVLLSPDAYGVGKTHLVCALANELINKTNPVSLNVNTLCKNFNTCPVYFLTECQMIDNIRNTFRPEYCGKSENNIYDDLISCPLLIVDDVGKIQSRDLSFLQSVYYRIFDGRYVYNRPIILTTNLNYSQLEAHIGGASADRLKAMCGENMIQMFGKSYR